TMTLLHILSILIFFSLSQSAVTRSYTLSLHGALPICSVHCCVASETWVSLWTMIPNHFPSDARMYLRDELGLRQSRNPQYSLRADRKSTRLNSSHVKISYAVFCLKKKKI